MEFARLGQCAGLAKAGEAVLLPDVAVAGVAALKHLAAGLLRLVRTLLRVANIVKGLYASFTHVPLRQDAVAVPALPI